MSGVVDIEEALVRMLGRAPSESERAIALDQAKRLEAGVYAHPLFPPPALGPLRLVRAEDLVLEDPFAPADAAFDRTETPA